MMVEEFTRLRRVWRDDNPLDVTVEEVRSMRADGAAAWEQYTRDTLGGPWNSAEWNLREALRQFQERWASYIEMKKRRRYEQERGPNWEQQSYYP